MVDDGSNKNCAPNDIIIDIKRPVRDTINWTIYNLYSLQLVILEFYVRQSWNNL